MIKIRTARSPTTIASVCQDTTACDRSGANGIEWVGASVREWGGDRRSASVWGMS
ncbi:hypothetical protein [Synechococcus sp. PCC 7336]|uniref:hypothetical protein n=1 Tax=Synechococcus sp. PCC 7336 TaxID=195250 RepID=UPI0003459EB2|nr:hypothetical protein [Synechococcus sp. PCC 7336]